MEDSNTTFEFIEQQLQDLKHRFSTADRVLADLVEIQVNFANLEKTYENMLETRENIKKYEKELVPLISETKETITSVKTSQAQFEKRFLELKNTIEKSQINLNDLEVKYENTKKQLNLQRNAAIASCIFIICLTIFVLVK